LLLTDKKQIAVIEDLTAGQNSAACIVNGDSRKTWDVLSVFRAKNNRNKNPNKDVLFGYCRRLPVCTVASSSTDRPLLKARHHPVVCAG
jgi:hypothetical protein